MKKISTHLRKSSAFINGLSMLSMLVATLGTLSAQQDRVFYVPMPETELRTYFNSYATTSASVQTVVSIVAAVDNTVIVYDHWEDGYEASTATPVQTTTVVWGDNNPGNGMPPGYAQDKIMSGDIINLTNLVTLPRNPGVIFYDGRDKIASNEVLMVTRAAWCPTPGSVLAGAVEMFDTSQYCRSFIAPVGYNTPNSYQSFEHSALFIVSAYDGNVVSVDRDANGVVDFTYPMDEGEVVMLQGTNYISQGARITSTKDIAVNLLSGDIGNNYENRWFTLYPESNWGNTFFNPVSTRTTAKPAVAYLFNPNASAITVNYTTLSGSGVTPSIPAKSSYRFTMPLNSGAQFTSTQDFIPVVCVDQPTSTSGGNVQDWGMALLPEDYLTTKVIVGWGPGSTDLSANGSPLWIAVQDETIVYVDYDGDLNTTGAYTGPTGF
ncbi:MAG TPA: hypothetical protein P5550_08575, partial [Bacteroidales bacterium]|nr:hypothetical protein [Bacteroidales bacterium]